MAASLLSTDAIADALLFSAEAFNTTASFLPPLLALLLAVLGLLYFQSGGIAWALSPARSSIPGPPGNVTALAGPNAHRVLAAMARSLDARDLTAFSVGFTRFIVSSHPDTAREILNSSAFADRPVKESAYELLFHRAMGFAPFGDYWRSLRKISDAHLFSPRRIAGHGALRRAIGEQMLRDIEHASAAGGGGVEIRRLAHFASLNNVMSAVFGRRFDFESPEGRELEAMVKEGYELLGMFNWADHLPLLRLMDLYGVRRRCRRLVARVNVFVGRIIQEHREKKSSSAVAGAADFVDVLLDLEEEYKLSDADMVAVLWEMLFRGTDTVAILLEWIMARMVLHPDIQSAAQAELDAVVGRGVAVTDTDVPRLRYLQCIVKESLRLHPPGPLLSWARLAVHDTTVGHHDVPAGTTAMVNMWAIAHDDAVWAEPEEFRPDRFLREDVSVLGSDLRLAPFGAGRRVCPGKAMGLATVHLWLAQLLHGFRWTAAAEGGVDMSERLKLSLEMEVPLVCKATAR